MYWDASPQGEIAQTDNRMIEINAANQITSSFPTRSLRADSILGFAGHEAGHILFTDFTMLKLYTQALSCGNFYPEEPSGLTPLQAVNLEKIKECFENNNKGVVSAILTITHSFVNMMEDLYIEARMMDAFPGSFKTGILLNNLRFAEDIPSVSDQVAKGHHDILIITNLLIQYAISGDVNNADGYKGKYLDALYECVPLIDDASYDDGAKARYEAANRMLIMLWPHMKSFIEQCQEDEKNHTDNAGTALNEQLANAGTALSDGSGKPAPSRQKFKHTPGSEEEDREAVQKVLDYETGRMELEKTEEIEDGDSGGISRDNSFAGSGYVSEAAAKAGIPDSKGCKKRRKTGWPSFRQAD